MSVTLVPFLDCGKTKTVSTSLLAETGTRDIASKVSVAGLIDVEHRQTVQGFPPQSEKVSE